MLRLLCILAGVLALSFLVTKGVLAPIGQWYEMNKARNFDDLSDAFVLALVAQAISAVVGGWLGDRVFRKWRQKRLDRQ
ncbi:hypothetical protein ACSFBF_30335 [Variovorax sp. ZT5P49]|uniref:hypothetical protein n=1 Tax=Variovorax sp. ZT5P49 TaxID=3443733 RepID=UPI003F48C345